MTLTFRFRPECLNDKDTLISVLEQKGWQVTMRDVTGEGLDDISKALGSSVFEFETRDGHNLARVIEAMADVPDGHRMLQTLDLAGHFTGVSYDGCEERALRVMEISEQMSIYSLARYLQVASTKVLKASQDMGEDLPFASVEHQIVDTARLAETLRSNIETPSLD